MNINYNDLATIFRRILTQIQCISGIIYNFAYDLEKFTSKNCKYIFSTKNLYILGKNTSKYLSRIIVVYVHATGLF